jgi:CCAAT-binding transcription factor (CBF-B/NF-YA) subunit B
MALKGLILSLLTICVGAFL